MSRFSFGNPSSWFNNVFFAERGGDFIYSLTNPGLPDFKSVFNDGYSEANMMLLFQIIPEFFFPVNAIAGRVKQGDYKLIDKDGKVVTDNNLWNKMLNDGPNWQYSFDDFIWHAVADRLVTGNRYGYAYTPSTLKLKHANIEALWLLPPHYTYPHMNPVRPSYLTTTKASEYVQYYQYTGGGDTMSQIPTDRVIHDIWMKMGDASDIITGKGISPFKAGEKPMSNIAAGYVARNAIFVKGGPMGAIVSAARDDAGTVAWTPEQKEEVIKDINTRYGFGAGQSPFAVTNQPLDYIKMGSTIKELEPFRENEASAAALCGIVGVPVALMPKGTDAKYSNLDISERNLYENVIFAEAESICKFLQRLGRFDELGYTIVVSFDHVTCLQDDALKFAQAYKSKVDASMQLYKDGLITYNEMRVDIGKEPIDGGDKYREEMEASNNPEEGSTEQDQEQGDSVKKGRVIKHNIKKLNCFNNGTR